MNILIAEFKDVKDADFIAQLIQKLQGKKGKVNVMNDAAWEEYVLGRMADKAEREGGTVTRATVAKHFRKHGVDF